MLCHMYIAYLAILRHHNFVIFELFLYSEVVVIFSWWFTHCSSKEINKTDF